jgi:broad specificity phosphatase PhoE
MTKLVLIKHSLPIIDPNKPAAMWQLSPEGAERCHRLATCLTDFLPAVLVSSVEPKAQATADHLAERLVLTATTIDGLEEQHRMTAPFFAHSALSEAMRGFFASPAELVFGEETAEAAFSRFSTTIDHLLGEHADRNLLVVTHGTVMSLYLSRWARIDPYLFWEKLGLPSFAVVDRRTMLIEKSEFQIA